ncbi:hypothetical protein F2S72_09535 [Pseudomonas syringae pv. actinidiae]|nr:hypothetical protein [Pseudomonas syringae pv. actinidiae]
MDEIFKQIANGLPGGWVSQPPPLLLPQHITNACTATNGSRRLMFLCVRGHLNSAASLFEVNSQLKKSGYETVWLFDGQSIPSTKHMPCASVQTVGDTVLATITNIGQATLAPQILELSQLAKAAADNRLRLADFEAGGKINVTFTSDDKVCGKCGTITVELQHATFQPADHPGAPGLTLGKSKIGRNVSRLIARAVRRTDSTPERFCNICGGQHLPHHIAAQKVTRTIGGIELSKLAAFELLRYNTTAWYVT